MIPLIYASALMLADKNMQITAGQVEYSHNKYSLSEKVQVVIPDNGTLTCTSAYFDQDNSKLILEGTPHNKVTYNGPDFTITCHRVTASVDPKMSSLETGVQELLAEGNVQIVYQGMVTAIADTGHFQNGLLVLTPTEESGSCHLTHERGDSIAAKKISFNLSEKKVTLTAPAGSIATEPRETRFNSGLLAWDITNHQLVLTDDIHIAQEDYGSLLVTDKLAILQDADNNLRSIVGEGTIAAALPNNQTLSCVGSFTIDHPNQTLIIKGSPITFRDTMGEIETDNATINYDKMKPTLIALAKNIKIQNFATVDKIVSDTCLHYILTDFATLDPITQTLTLLSESGKKSLLYDKVNNIQVSARSLTVKRNEETKKDTIKGHGDVRFSFSEKEFNLLKQRFKMLKDAEPDTLKS